jgi:hypothetical protein
MDIRAAFDTIKQDKMMEVVSGLLDQVRTPNLLASFVRLIQ